MSTLRSSVVRGGALSLAVFFVSLSPHSAAQDSVKEYAAAPTAADASVRDLQVEVRQLRMLLDEMRVENAQSRTEMQQLRQDLQATRALLEQPGGSLSGPTRAQTDAPPALENHAQPARSDSGEAALEERVQKLEDSTTLLGDKVDEQYQTKVETASKYRARLHGIVLMNAFRNVGGSDSIDFPSYAVPLRITTPQASFGATLRQSEIGFEIFGPIVAGARTSADIQFDFAGGFPTTGNAENFGLVRLQTASLRFDWEHTSFVAGQDSLFISPLSPTSFASLATPAFAFAGNLWGWTPQLRVEHRFSITDQQTLTLQAGILDNLDWEFPTDQFYRYPQAGEKSGQPAYAARAAWSRPVRQHPLNFGAAGYYGRQNWNWYRIIDAWAGMADWQIPLAPHVSLSGEFYRGRGIGGLGGAVGRSIVYGGTPTFGLTPIRATDAAGGWTQLKFQLTPKVELNGVIAQDDTFTNNIRGFASDPNNFVPILGRNRGAFANIIFRPRSDLVLSAEMRRLQSFPVYSSSSAANQVNLAVGILF